MSNHNVPRRGAPRPRTAVPSPYSKVPVRHTTGAIRRLGGVGRLDLLLPAHTLLIDTVHGHVNAGEWSWTGDMTHWTAGPVGGGARKRASATARKVHPLHGNYYHDRATGWNVRVLGNVLIITGNVRRVVHPDNLYPVTTYDVPAILQYIDAVKARIGIAFNIHDVNVNQAHLAVDATLPMDCASFVSQLARVRRFYGMTLTLQPETYGASIRWERSRKIRNKTIRERAVAVYDKGKEMRYHGQLPPPGHIIRIEYRLTRQRTCRREGICTLLDALDPVGKGAIWVRLVRRLLSAAWRAGAIDNGRAYRKRREGRQYQTELYRNGHAWRELAVWTDSMLPIPRELTDAEIERMAEDSS